MLNEVHVTPEKGLYFSPAVCTNTKPFVQSAVVEDESVKLQRLSQLTRANILELLCDSIDDARFMLQHEKLYAKLSMFEIIKVIGSHRELADQVFASGFQKNLSGRELAMLCHKHIELAEAVLKDQTLTYQLGSNELVLLGQHLAIALQLIKSPRLGNDDIVKLCSLHPKVKEKVINEYSWENGISLYRALACANLDIANEFRGKEYFNISTDGLELGEHHVEFALEFLSKFNFNPSDRYRHEYYKYVYERLGKHLEVARVIFANSKIREILRSYDLIEIASLHLEIAYLILSQEELWSSFSGDELAKMAHSHVEIVRQVLVHPVLGQKLSVNNLAFVASADPQTAMIMLDTTAYWDELTGYSLVHLGNSSLLAAQSILNTPELYSRLESYDLRELGEHDERIALQILTHQELSTKLTKHDLANMGSHSIEAATVILENKSLFYNAYFYCSILGGQLENVATQMICNSFLLVWNCEGYEQMRSRASKFQELLNIFAQPKPSLTNQL